MTAPTMSDVLRLMGDVQRALDEAGLGGWEPQFRALSKAVVDGLTRGRYAEACQACRETIALATGNRNRVTVVA